jgi:toxin ParE1/3/4
MQRLEVKYRLEASNDILNIFNMVFQNSSNLITADTFVSRIEKRCQSIGNAPYGGKPRDDLLAGLRTVPFEKRTIIAYIIVNETVEITNVFYGGRDYEALFE